MGFSFTFLRANDLRQSLLIIRARSFLLSVRRGYIRKVSVQLVPKYFSCGSYLNSGEIGVHKIDMSLQPADVLTKPLNSKLIR